MVTRSSIRETLSGGSDSDDLGELAGLLTSGSKGVDAKSAQKPKPTASTGRINHKSRSSSRERRGENRIVAVFLDHDVIESMRASADETDRTHGGVALEAVASHMDELSRRWESTSKNSGSPFHTESTRIRRSTGGRPVQIRISPHDIGLLDEMVEEWSAPSRSAVVNEALRMHLRI